jgi:hypothetical protein
VTRAAIRYTAYGIIAAALFASACGFALYRRGLERGGQTEKVAALDLRSKTGRAQISIDSVKVVVEEKKLAPVIARSHAARRELTITPGSDTIYVAGEMPTVSPGIVKVIATQDTTIEVQASVIAARSAESSSLRSQLWRSDSTTAVLRDMKTPRCSARCGVAIGAAAVIAIVFGISAIAR